MVPRAPAGAADVLGPVFATLAAFAAIIAALAASGHFGLWLSPDTPSYLAAVAAAEPLGQMRLPLYGWLVGGLIDGPSAWLLPWLQTGLFAAAAFWLVAALRGLGVSTPIRLAVGMSLACSNMMLLWAVAAMPELPAHAAMLAALALTVELAAGRSMRWRIPAAALSLALGWALRPSLLAFIPLLPLLLLALPSRQSRRARITPASWLLLAGLLPMLALSGLRLARVGDFNVVSFGGFQMSGMTALMLTPELAARLPPQWQADAARIIANRDALVAAGQATDIPANSAGLRSFPSLALGYFDMLARSHDTILYRAVAPLRGASESWVAFNARMQRLALAILRAAPADYAAWVVGATARLVGHALVLNPAFLLASALFLLSLLRPCRTPAPPDLPALAALSGMWTFGTGALVVLVTFPAARYIDSVMLFLPAWPLSGALLRVTR